MAKSNIMIPFIKRWEGGWANDPDDRGGATMMGVTINTYKAYCAKTGRPVPTADDLRMISETEWRDIFKTLYWDKWRADLIIDQSIAHILVDWVWASGNYGISIPQRLLGVPVDSIVGPKTLSALNSYPNQRELFHKIMAARKQYIEDICIKTPTNAKFKKGWLNRLDSILYNETNSDNISHFFRSM